MSDDSVTVQLKGTEDVIAAFRELREEMPSNFLRSAVKKGAQLLQGLLEAAAPVLTGRLARNISVRTHETAQTIRARVTVNTVGKAGNPSNAFYWRFLVKGWHDRAGVAHQEDFVTPVVQAKEEAAAQEDYDAVERAIDKAEQKAAHSV